MSCCGIPNFYQKIPSVITTQRSNSASKASIIASAAPGGGTYITEALQPVAFLA